MRRIILTVFVGVAVLLAAWMPGALAQDGKEKPVIEQMLDLLLQRGQISQEEYRSLQEKAKKEQASTVLAGIEKGKPFLQSPDGDFRLEFGGRLQTDFDAAEGDTGTLTGENKLRSGNVVPRRQFLPIAGKMGPGAWEVGVRYAELDFESDDPIDFADGNLSLITGGGRSAANGVQALTLGVNWYLSEHLRWMVNWTNYWYDNALGTPFSCPTTCAATNPTNLRPGDDSSWEILSRLQVWF